MPPKPTSLAGSNGGIARVEASAYTVPTDRPESDGTFEWTSTTMVLAEVSACGASGLGYSYTGTAAVAVQLHQSGGVGAHEFARVLQQQRGHRDVHARAEQHEGKQERTHHRERQARAGGVQRPCHSPSR